MNETKKHFILKTVHHLHDNSGIQLQHENVHESFDENKSFFFLQMYLMDTKWINYLVKIPSSQGSATWGSGA